jgi:predicted DNA-binding transcriptional regulator YafY
LAGSRTSAIEAQTLVFNEDGFALFDVPIEEETWAARELTRVGAEVEVLEPLTLRERMTDIARRLANFYGV